jgi:hypothetical protein
MTKPKPEPKPRRERIRGVIKSIILDYFITAQWQVAQDHHRNKRWQYWKKRRLYRPLLSYGKYPVTLAQTETQLLKVIVHSGYTDVNRETVRRCLEEMAQDGILNKPPGSLQYNQKPYILPLKSMPSYDFLFMEEISKLMALRCVDVDGNPINN